MNVVAARVTECRRMYGNTYVLWLLAPEISRGARPGQFVMVRCGTTDDPLLPRALSFYRIRDTEHGREFGLLFEVVGRGTAWMSRLRPGEHVSLHGPLGNGYHVRGPSTNLLLIGGGIGIAPLVWLADDAVARGQNVTLLAGARTGDDVYPAESLPAEVEFVTATDDGTSGYRGYVTDLVPQYTAWCDQIFVCGPTPMFATLAGLLRAAQFRRSCQVLLEERMACGTGICYSCSVETRRQGMKLICKDGPRFELREIF